MLIKNLLIIAPSPPPFGGMATQANLLSDKLKQQGIHVVKVSTNSMPKFFKRVFGDIAGVRTVIKTFYYFFTLIKSVYKSDVIHILACSHLYFFINVIPAIIIGKLFKKRIVVNYRGGEAKLFFNGSGKYAKNILNNADAFIVPSAYLKSVFDDLNIRSSIIPNIADIDSFSFSPPDYSASVKFVCTRNFEYYYDVATLIRAFAIVRRKLRESSLTLIGDGSLKKELLNIVSEYGLSSCVNFKGRVSPSDMPYVLSQHDIFVNSSIVDNYPISILEAFAIGLPVISTSAGGIPFLIKDGIDGLLVPLGDAKALASEMIRLAKDLSLGRYLAYNGKINASMHSWEHIWLKLKTIYQY